MLLHYLVKHYCLQNKPLTTNYKVVWQHIECTVGLIITKLGKVYCGVCQCFFKLVNIWQSFTSKNVIVSCAFFVFWQCVGQATFSCLPVVLELLSAAVFQ